MNEEFIPSEESFSITQIPSYPDKMISLITYCGRFSEIMDIHVQSARNLLFRSIEKIRKETSMDAFIIFLHVMPI